MTPGLSASMSVQLELQYLRRPVALFVQVFCTKRSPNCTACPLRHECDYALANGRHLEPQAAQPKKATPGCPRKSAQSRSDAMLVLPPADTVPLPGGTVF